MKDVLKDILAATTKAEEMFVEREQILREGEMTGIKPLVERLIVQINLGSMTDEAIVEELEYIQFQLDLKTKMREKFSIIRSSRNILIEIRSLALIGLLTVLKSQASIDETVTIEDLIHKIQAAINQKNYAVMKELIFVFDNL